MPKKLGIKDQSRVGTLRSPEHLTELLDPLPPGARVLTVRRGAPAYDVVLLFVNTERDLEKHFERARAAMTTNGGLWVCWPKKSSPLHRGLGDAGVRAFGLASGLVDNKVCAVDADWSGLRFVVRVRDR